MRAPGERPVKESEAGFFGTKRGTGDPTMFAFDTDYDVITPAGGELRADLGLDTASVRDALGDDLARRWSKPGEDGDRFSTEILVVPGHRVQFLDKPNGGAPAQADDFGTEDTTVLDSGIASSLQLGRRLRRSPVFLGAGFESVSPPNLASRAPSLGDFEMVQVLANSSAGRILSGPNEQTLSRFGGFDFCVTPQLSHRERPDRCVNNGRICGEASRAQEANTSTACFRRRFLAVPR